MTRFHARTQAARYDLALKAGYDAILIAMERLGHRQSNDRNNDATSQT
jgi:hypothetical protein